MTIRTPGHFDPENLTKFTQEVKESSSLKWHELQCELITPMYGGGVESTKVDQNMPIRVTGIRGQLRFWWRLLAKQDWYKDETKNIRQKEFALWGGMDSEGEDGKASLVFLRVKTEQSPSVEAWAKYEKNHKGKQDLKLKNWANVQYALFPAQGTLKNRRTEVDEYPHELLKAPFRWTLQIAFAPSITDKQKDEVWQTLRWWANFGGVGARTRRGLGAFCIEKTKHFDYVVTPEEVEEIGLSIRLSSPKNNPYTAWRDAVNKLQRFRQIGEGRNDHSSRSHWSEPDAIRDLTGQSLPEHRERKTQHNIFPRIHFGLPIIFKFKDGGDNKNTDPKETILKAKYKNGDEEKNWWEIERMSSPLILRPYRNQDGQYCSMALCLPEKLNKNIQLILSDTDKSNSWKQAVEPFDKEKAKDIKPLKSGDEVLNPLQAFLNYFDK